MGLVLRAPGMVSATDMTVMLLSSWSTVKLLPEVKVTVLGSQGSSRKALSLNLQQRSQPAQGQHLQHCHHCQIGPQSIHTKPLGQKA